MFSAIENDLEIRYLRPFFAVVFPRQVKIDGI